MKQQMKRRTASKKLRAVQTSRHLHVAQHRHTGHVLSRRSTSYPLLTMIVLCVGVFLGSWTHYVTADTADYTVHTSVVGPPPTVAATIDTPTEGAHFTATPVTVSGTCPQDTYVALFRNGFGSGVALCDAGGNYQITTDLFKGTNQLMARDYSFGDAPGPDSATVTVEYQPPGVSIPAGATSTPYSPGTTSSAGVPEPLLLKTNFTFLGYYVGQPATWQINIEGGTPPYAIDAEWGDGSHQLYSHPKAGPLSLQHTYKRSGGYHGSYVVKITSSDADSNQTILQVLAIISNRPKTVVGSGSQDTTGGGGASLLNGRTSLTRLVSYTWTGYGIVILMLVSFWLGERRELGFLRIRTKRARHS